MSHKPEYKTAQIFYEEQYKVDKENSDGPDNDPEKLNTAREHYQAEIMLIATEDERKLREEARTKYGEHADDGHDNRIEKLKEREEYLKRRIANLVRREAEEESERRGQQVKENQHDDKKEYTESNDEENNNMDLGSDDDY